MVYQNHQHNQSVGSCSQKIAHFHVITMIMKCDFSRSLREISCSSDDRDWEVGRTGTWKRKNTSTTDQKKVPSVSGGSELPPIIYFHYGFVVKNVKESHSTFSGSAPKFFCFLGGRMSGSGRFAECWCILRLGQGQWQPGAVGSSTL